MSKYLQAFLMLFASSLATRSDAGVINPSDRIVLTDLGAGVIPTAINNVGQVAGQANGVAFRWTNGTLTPLGTLGGAQSYANDINDSGVVVGWAHDSAGKMKSFSWNGSMTNLDATVAFEGSAEAINSAGYTVGWRTNGTATRSVRWNEFNPNGQFLFQSTNHKALGVNDHGEVVGITLTVSGGADEGFYWEGFGSTSNFTNELSAEYFPIGGVNGTHVTAGDHANGGSYLELGDSVSIPIPRLLPSDQFSRAFALNDLNVIVGECGEKGFLYDLDTQCLYDVNSFTKTGVHFDAITRLTDINNSNAFVGVGLINGIEHGVYGQLVALDADFDGNNVVDAEDLSNWQYGYGVGAPHIAGDADYDGDADGDDFLIWQRQVGIESAATAVPEPRSVALLAVSLFTLFLRRPAH